VTVDHVHHATRQSPIFLRWELDAQPQPGYLQLLWSRHVVARYRGHNPAGHGTHFSVAPRFGGVELDGTMYVLQGLHFHAPSEHLLHVPGSGEARQFAGELHLVHRELQSARLVVLAVFLELAADGNPRACGRFRKAVEAESTTDPFDPVGLLPAESKRDFLRYQGSLTTGDYDEIVSWVVFETPISICDEDLAAFDHRVDEDPRAVQDRDHRLVVRCPDASVSVGSHDDAI
jgi:carbonic anhydrase